MGINQAGSPRLLLVMPLPCAAGICGEILLLFQHNDHNYKHHLLCVPGRNFLEVALQPGSVALMFGPFLFLLQMGSSLRMNPHAPLLETAVEERGCREGQRPLPWCPCGSPTNSLAHWFADYCLDNQVMTQVEPERN